MKSVCLINNQCDPQSKIDTLNGQKVNITLSKLVEDDAKDDIVEVKSVKYRELITKSQDDSNTDDRGRQIRLHHLMVIKAPPNIHENNMDREAEEVKSDVEEEDARSTSKYTGCTCACPRVCPPRGQVASILTISTILITLWAVSYCVLGEVALPGMQSNNDKKSHINGKLFQRSSSHLCNNRRRNLVLFVGDVHCLLCSRMVGPDCSSSSPSRNASHWDFTQEQCWYKYV